MQTETLHIKKDQSQAVTLNNRGSSGLQMKVRTDHEGIVEIHRLETARPRDLKPGDPLKVVFNITGKRRGIVKVTFYETQPWNKLFKEIVAKELIVEVD